MSNPYNDDALENIIKQALENLENIPADSDDIGPARKPRKPIKPLYIIIGIVAIVVITISSILISRLLEGASSPEQAIEHYYKIYSNIDNTNREQDMFSVFFPREIGKKILSSTGMDSSNYISHTCHSFYSFNVISGVYGAPFTKHEVDSIDTVDSGSIDYYKKPIANALNIKASSIQDVKIIKSHAFFTSYSESFKEQRNFVAYKYHGRWYLLYPPICSFSL